MATAESPDSKKSDSKSDKGPVRRRKERKNIVNGIAHVNASFNNTIITITDAQGNTIAWSSSRADGLQGFA